MMSAQGYSPGGSVSSSTLATHGNSALSMGVELVNVFILCMPSHLPIYFNIYLNKISWMMLQIDRYLKKIFHFICSMYM